MGLLATPGIHVQPGGGGMGIIESEQKAHPPTYEKQSNEGMIDGTEARIMNNDNNETPQAYFDINPSAPALSVSVGMVQDLESFLRKNELDPDAYIASLREAGADNLDNLKDLSDEEIKQVAIDIGMDETDQQLFVDACMKLKQ